MMRDAPPLRVFVTRALLWLAPCFALWYFGAPYHSAIAGSIALVLANIVSPGLVSTSERQGSDLVFVTSLEVQPAPGQTAVMLLEVDPLLYTYGLAFFVALMLATGFRWRAILAGAAMLLPFQAWGIAFDLLAQAGLKLGPDIAAQAGLANWRREVIALGYQVGTLMFPTLMPVVFWGAFNRRLIESALRSTTPGLEASGGQRVLPRELRAQEEDLRRAGDP